MSRKVIGIPNAFEKAISFNGSDNYARVSANGASFQFTGAYTLGCWLKEAAAGNAGKILMGNNQIYIEVGTGGDRPSVTYAGHWNENITETPLKDLGWHFVVATIDGTTLRIYCDGRQSYAAARPDAIDLPTADTYFAVGAKQDGTSLFAGSIKCAFVCNSAITSAKIVDLFKIGPQSEQMVTALTGTNLKALWPFNNAYTDVSGNGNTLLAVNTPNFADVNGSSFGRGARSSA